MPSKLPRGAICLFIIALLASLSFQVHTPSAHEVEKSSPPTKNTRFRMVADAETPPPQEPIYEVEPDAREGYLWAKGYWAWNGKRYFWQHGRWIKGRPGYEWVTDSWVERGRGWRFYPGHWEKMDSEIDVEGKEAEEVLDIRSECQDAAIARTPKPHKARKGGHGYHNKRLWIRTIHH